MMKNLLALLILALIPAAWALPQDDYNPAHPLVTGHKLPKEFQGVGVDEHLGKNISLSTEFVADNGETVRLGRYFETGHPVLMAMVYYTCPNLCNYHLNGLMEAMKNLKWRPGQDFQIVAVSMNPSEGPDVASKKKANYVKAFGHPETINGWHFLTGKEENIKKLAGELGFKYKWIPAQKQFAHTSVTYVLTPGGTISRYIYGIAPSTQMLKLSLLEASNGKIGTVVDQVLLYCFHFDPGQNKYVLYAWNVMRIGAAMTAILIALIMVPMWFKERRSKGDNTHLPT